MARRPGWRYIAQHPFTGEFLDWELPLSDVSLTRRLSGPWAASAKIEPVHLAMLNPDGSRLLDEWAVQVWAELDGVIRGGGILTGSTPGRKAWALTFEGHARYPYGIPYLGRFREANVDVFDVAREIWRHVQSYDDGDLGVTLTSGKAGVLLGTEVERVEKKGGGKVDRPVPYDLAWFDTPDCGDEFENLAQEAPFEYLEAHEWGSGDTIKHRIDMAHPRLGRRRTDITFVEGENLAVSPDVDRDGSEFAQYVVGLGAGEGRKRRRTPELGSPDGRLRRVHMLERSDVKSEARLRTLANAEKRARRVALGRIPEVVVTDHPNARLGSWELGDEVLVSLRAGWAHDDVWCRIVEETITPATADRAAVLKLSRADGL